MQRTGARLIKYIGTTTLDDLTPKFKTTVGAASSAIEAKYPKVTEAKIQGSDSHKSSKDPTDEKDVITVSYHTEAGTRVTSIHAHDDNTYKEFPSRNAGRGK